MAVHITEKYVNDHSNFELGIYIKMSNYPSNSLQ